MNNALSFIRTVTVGFGLAPNLLTLTCAMQTRRSRACALHHCTAITAGGEFRPALRTLPQVGLPRLSNDTWLAQRRETLERVERLGTIACLLMAVMEMRTDGSGAVVLPATLVAEMLLHCHRYTLP
jgi:hypothetical protein